MKLRIELYMYQ